jgi:hypothetical protein
LCPLPAALCCYLLRINTLFPNPAACWFVKIAAAADGGKKQQQEQVGCVNVVW